MNQELSIEPVVMRRVYVIWFCSAAPHSILAKLLILVFLLGAIYLDVSPGMIWQNAHTAGGLANYRFFTAALMHTEIMVQLTLVAFALVFSWLAKDLWFRYVRLFARFSLSTLTGFFSRARS